MTTHSSYKNVKYLNKIDKHNEIQIKSKRFKVIEPKQEQTYKKNLVFSYFKVYLIKKELKKSLTR